MTAAYRINLEKKQIIIDDEIKMTKIDEGDIFRYVSAGYVIKHKSEERKQKASKRADKITDKFMYSLIDVNDETEKEFINKLKEYKNFFARKKYFKEIVYPNLKLANEYDKIIKSFNLSKKEDEKICETFKEICYKEGYLIAKEWLEGIKKNK